MGILEQMKICYAIYQNTHLQKQKNSVKDFCSYSL